LIALRIFLWAAGPAGLPVYQRHFRELRGITEPWTNGAPGLLDRGLVSLAFHRPLGALERRPFPFREPSRSIVAEADASFFERRRV
jgi:hypothetical protein